MLSILIAISIGCSQLPETSDDTTTNTADNNPLSTDDLNNYKKALYSLRDNDLTKAEVLLMNVTKRHPNLAGPHANIGLIYYKQGKIKKATQSLNKVIQLNPRNPYAYNLLGIIKNDKGDFLGAEKYFLLAIKYKKDYAKAQYNIALLYDIYFHKIQESINHYQQYLNIIKEKGIKDKQTRDWVKQLQSSLKQG